ncbi:unannotated protein [freshwater metagenome]|uniref:Unannotated protein n=1 Tax=freshwater metagenome TaxID=449393 RepID=A0A6J7LG35_9ZZZZ
MIDPTFADEPANRFGHHDRIGAIELQRSGRFIRGEGGQLPTLLAPFEQAASVHHLAHVQTGAVAATQATEGAVGDTGHRREHDGRVDRQGADGERALHEPSR